MKAAFEQVRDVSVITLEGRLDTDTAPIFDAQAAPFLKEPKPQILVDLAAVTYISSSGLRSILQLVKHTAAHGGRLGLFAAAPQIVEVIEISGFPSLLDVYADRESALAGKQA